MHFSWLIIDYKLYFCTSAGTLLESLLIIYISNRICRDAMSNFYMTMIHL